jgi:hypothetical protein
MVEVFRPRRRSPFPQENPAVCEVKVKLMGMGVQSFGVRKHVVKRVHVSSLQGSTKMWIVFVTELEVKSKWLEWKSLGVSKKGFLSRHLATVFRKLIYLVRWFGYDHQPYPGLIICIYICISISIRCLYIYIRSYIFIYIYIYLSMCIYIYIYMVTPLKPTFFTYSSHSWVKRGLPYIQAYFEEILAIVSRGATIYVCIVV